MYPWATNHHFLIRVNQEHDEGRETQENSHLLVKGVASTECHRYGLHLASKSSLPESVIETSYAMAEQLQEIQTTVQELDMVDRRCVDLVTDLKNATQLGLNDEELITQLRSLQLHYTEQLDQIGNEEDSEDEANDNIASQDINERESQS